MRTQQQIEKDLEEIDTKINKLVNKGEKEISQIKMKISALKAKRLAMEFISNEVLKDSEQLLKDKGKFDDPSLDYRAKLENGEAGMIRLAQFRKKLVQELLEELKSCQ